VAASSASRTGSWSGRSIKLVLMCISVVRARSAPPITSGEGVYPSSTKWCSVSQTERYPSSSAQTIWSSVSA
jgi:hypothetical protein